MPVVDYDTFRLNINSYRYSEHPPNKPDGRKCNCGKWEFYSSICGHVFQKDTYKCGYSRTVKGNDTSWCPGTSGRQMVSRTQVKRKCRDCEHKDEEAAAPAARARSASPRNNQQRRGGRHG